MESALGPNLPSARAGSAPSFAALCGVAPVPASSGKTRRYRLSRGGDRHANSALHRIGLQRNDTLTTGYRAWLAAA
jgi:transposase